MPHVTSKDGTRMAYEVSGQGPPLVVARGALGLMASPFAQQMHDELAKSFTVDDGDRCGRGGSGDTKPYALEREVEDLVAVRAAADGNPFVWATSSGAALALEAAAVSGAAKAIPGAQHRVIAGQDHGVKPAALRPVLAEVLR